MESVPFGELTVAYARAEDLAPVLSDLTGLGPRVVKRRLSEGRGNVRLRNAFRDEWPDRERLLRLRVAFARDWGMQDEIARWSGLSPRAVLRRLRDESGGKLVGTAFPELVDEVAPAFDPVELGRRRVARVRDDERAIDEIARLVGLTPRTVRGRLQEAPGLQLVENLLAGRWPEPVAPVLPIVAGRWQLVEHLGGGGFGEAYEAIDLKIPGQRCVIKTARGEVPVERLRQEVAMAMLLQHQNICAYRHLDEDPAVGAFVVMSHGGRSLADIIGGRRRFPLATALDVLRQAAAGIDHAHEHGVLHQDVKPGNLLLEERSGGWRVRISDFGISLYGTARRRGGRATVMANAAFGWSDGYASPEQMTNRPVSRKSDQYSLALVLCSMIEWRVFVEPGEHGPYEALSRRQNKALARALDLDPRARFESCAAFVAALGGR